MSSKDQFQLFSSINEYFIPLRHVELVKRLKDEYAFTENELRQFDELVDSLISIFHAEHLHEWLRIDAQYKVLDPDSFVDQTTKRDQAIESDSTANSDDDQATLAERFFDRLSSLLHNAHYQRLTYDQIEQAVNLGSQWGVRLDVNFDLFAQMDVYVRGYQKVKIKRRRWQNFFREEEIELPEFQRLVLAFRIRPDDAEESPWNHKCVYLKKFKDIPETDLEILLPGSQVRLSIVDRGKILVPTLSGIAVTIYKIVRAAAVLTIATLAGIWGWVVLIGALTAYVVKSVLGFVRTKDKYRFDLTQNLYLKNLDNNAGVLYRLFHESEEQELCETLLGYVILLKSEAGDLEADDVRQRAEAILRSLAGVNVKFAPHDSLAKLTRLGLADVDSAGRWTAIKIQRSKEVLEKKWFKLIKI